VEDVGVRISFLALLCVVAGAVLILVGSGGLAWIGSGLGFLRIALHFIGFRRIRATVKISEQQPGT
jgi:hypothetical protein